ncbi:MAG: D-alanyl-D-alanine carboxypeptidase [Ruminococcus sp.]|nr:D-alanyl-D-alanine carboxypeptidase [Ruminococcus sp.]
MKLLKRLCLILTAAVMFALSAPLSAAAVTFVPTNGKDENKNLVPIYLYSPSVYMVEVETGEPLVDINSEEKLSPGYLTQLMTCAIILDEFNGNEKKLKETKVSSGSEAYDELYDTGAPTADIRPGEEVSYYDILVSMILCSSCEAANITALNLADSLFDFTLRMNDKAKELGMENTNFSSAHGFYITQNYSTAKDMARLCRYLVNTYPLFRKLCSLQSQQLEATDIHPEGTNLYNDNFLLNTYTDYYYQFADGIKSSTQSGSGRCLASIASYDGNEYLIVTLNAPIEKTPSDVNKGIQDPDSIYGDDYVYYSVLDHRALYGWAFNSLVLTDFINPNSEITDVKVEFGAEADYVNLKPKKGYSMLWPVDIDINQVEKKITVYDNVIAPIEKGDALGKMELIYNGEVLASIDLISTSTVTRSQSASRLKIASSFYRSSEFRWAMFIIIMIFAVYSISYFIYLQLKYMKLDNKDE